MGKYNIIAIERQFGSGGKRIGILLAEKLGFQFYGEEILQMAARKLNISPEYVQHLEETATNIFLYAKIMAENITEDQPLADKLFYTESKIINELALTGNCVVVGRCAGQVLVNQKSCLRIFIHASEDVRIKRAVEEYGILENEVHNVLRKNDRRRSGFYSARAEKKWTSMDTYDICLNSGILGIDACVEIIATAAIPHTNKNF